MLKNTQYLRFQSWIISLLVLYGIPIIFRENQVQAQIIPDKTLVEENSVVTPINPQRDRIDGGAIRGSNLFHSFTEFNIGEGKEAYFSNPAVIENIFSRVTGSNPSRIFGRLGVLGDANLFLLNPKGIIFGDRASLDIKGSFFATTASSFDFGEGKNYSAINPTAPPLLSVNVKPPIGLEFEGVGGDIENRGNLVVGKDLTLQGNSLDLQGRLEAGENLTLKAEDTVKVRDSVDKAFIAASGDKLLIQGKERVDIFALNHAGSGLFSGGDMVLQSTRAVIGDVDFLSGGRFRVEKLDGSLGSLSSPNGSIIRAGKDVSFDSYTGASLHIFAGGSVNVPGEIKITDTTKNSIREQVTLSDGETVIDIDGNSQPTLDIRAGIVGIGDDLTVPITNDSGASADININSISNATGTVFLTNQYQPNSALSGGISTGGIDTSSDFGGGDVFLDSKGEIKPNGLINVSGGNIFGSNFSGNGGNIRLFADGDISLGSRANFVSLGLLGGNITFKSNANIFIKDNIIQTSSFINTIGSSVFKGGDINVETKSLDITNAILAATTAGKANGGEIIIDAKATTSINGFNTRIATQVFAVDATGNAGDLRIKTNRLLVDEALLLSDTLGNGNAGDLKVQVGELRLSGGAQLATRTFSQGDTGDLAIKAESVEVIGRTTDGRFSTGLFVRVESEEATGNGGTLTIDTERLLVTDGARISATTFGKGDAADFLIRAKSVEVIGESADAQFSSGLFAQADEGSTGNGGNLNIETERLLVTDGAEISVSTLSSGNAGNLTVKAQSVELTGETANTSNRLASGLFSQAVPGSSGNGGDLTIETQSLVVKKGSQIAAATWGSGDAGNLTVKAQSVDIIGTTNDGVFPSGLFTAVNPEATGSGGNLRIDTGSLRIIDGAAVSSSTFGNGDAGDLTIEAQSVEVLGNNGTISSSLTLGVDPGATGSGGKLKINTGSLKIADTAVVFAGTFGNGDAGSIEVTANIFAATNGGRILTTTSGKSKAGDITLNIKDNLTLTGSETGIFANTTETSTGNGGSIIIDPEVVNIFDGAQISVNSSGSGIGGDIELTAGKLNLDNGTISAETRSNTGGNITLNIQDLLLFRNGSEISTTAGNEQFGGDGGNIKINTPDGFIVAFPNENSNISANAFEGDGGRIDITAFGIFGIEFRDKPTSLSDITASSEFGSSGTVNIQTPGIEPNPESEQLVEDAQTTEVAQGCQSSGESAVAFFNIGRGGLPPQPGDTLSGNNAIANWIPLVLEGSEKEEKVSRVARGVKGKGNLECRI